MAGGAGGEGEGREMPWAESRSATFVRAIGYREAGLLPGSLQGIQGSVGGMSWGNVFYIFGSHMRGLRRPMNDERGSTPVSSLPSCTL